MDAVKAKSGVLNRKLLKADYKWLKRDFEEGEKVYRFTGATYGCISGDGIAVTLNENGDNPFFEVPDDSVDWSK